MSIIQMCRYEKKSQLEFVPPDGNSKFWVLAHGLKGSWAFHSNNVCFRQYTNLFWCGVCSPELNK